MFSLIFQGLGDRTGERIDAFKAAFGELGCCMSLNYDAAKHAPCELAANLTREDAERKAVILREAGLTVEIVPTTEITDVKHRASECWPTHRATNGESFTERDFVVVRGVSLNLKERLRLWRDSYLPFEAWAFELGYNHEHPTTTLDRHGLRASRERGAQIGAALTECFPTRRFLLAYRDEQVSFCQFTKDLPVGISPGERRVIDLRVRQGQGSDVCYCEICERATSYIIRPLPDDEFPCAQFADCAVCGCEIILWADQETVFASDAARQNFPVADVPVDGWKWFASDANLPSSFADLKTAVGERLHPSREWRLAAIRLWLGREPDDLGRDQPLFAQTLLQIEELSALILAYRMRQLSLPRESQDQTPLTPERLGIARSNPMYHPVRRALAPVTVVTRIEQMTTSHALLNGTDEFYLAGRRLEPERPVYEGRFSYGVLETRGRTFWSTGVAGKLHHLVNDVAPHGAEPWTWRTYGAAKSLKFIREIGTERCLAYTILFDEKGCVTAQHRRFLLRFHELDIAPDPVINLSLSDGILTLRSDVFVWGVFLGWHDAKKLPDNAFDLLPREPYCIPWDEAICGTPKVWRTGNSLLR